MSVPALRWLLNRLFPKSKRYQKYMKLVLYMLLCSTLVRNQAEQFAHSYLHFVLAHKREHVGQGRISMIRTPVTPHFLPSEALLGRTTFGSVRIAMSIGVPLIPPSRGVFHTWISKHLERGVCAASGTSSGTDISLA